MIDRGIDPDVITFSAAISACTTGGQWEKALDLFREMQSRGIDPDVITFSAAISACEKGRQWEKALDLFREMQSRGIDPNEITYNATIAACFNAERYSEALNLASRAQEQRCFPNFTNPKLSILDLHGLSLASSCMVVVDSLLSAIDIKRHERSAVRDITIVTGKGIGSGPDGPVLVSGVPQFLRDCSGPEITLVEANEGCFVITKGALQVWGESPDFEKFKEQMSNPR
jgi:pentatricopeptide repeat protein